jgi:hypothetical protein
MRTFSVASLCNHSFLFVVAFTSDGGKALLPSSTKFGQIACQAVWYHHHDCAVLVVFLCLVAAAAAARVTSDERISEQVKDRVCQNGARHLEQPLGGFIPQHTRPTVWEDATLAE